MDYLARYANGEYQQVWDELIKLGPEIRQGDLYAQAEAVARETMRRVRTNLETLVERLKTLNFNFQYPPLTPLDPDELKELAGFDRQYGPFPLSIRIFFEEVGSVDFMGSHPKLCEYTPSPSVSGMSEKINATYQKHFGEMPEPDPASSINPTLGLLYQLMQEAGKGAASKDNPERMAKLSAFAHDLAGNFSLEVGPMPGMKPVNPTPKKPKEEKPEVLADPLVFEFNLPEIDPDIEEDEEESYKDAETGLYICEVAPDALHKSNYSGGGPIEFLFPDFAIDAKLRCDDSDYGYFVSYLRECFEWGGFPGLKDSKKPPRKELEFLTKDLLPI
jgi:hypothetical protein